MHVAAPDSGRGYFTNVGDTLRQGIELGMRYTDKKLMIYANYALVDATIQTNFSYPRRTILARSSVQRRSGRPMREGDEGRPHTRHTASISSRPASSTGSHRR